MSASEKGRVVGCVAPADDGLALLPGAPVGRPIGAVTATKDGQETGRSARHNDDGPAARHSGTVNPTREHNTNGA